MASPAASSAARLMRYPELRRSIDLLARSLVATSWRWALNASTLLLMRRDIRLLLDDVVCWSRGRLHVAPHAGDRSGAPRLEAGLPREARHRTNGQTAAPRAPLHARGDAGHEGR